MLLDPERSWALLVGTSTYRSTSDLPDIPAVRNNIRDLGALLADPSVGRLFSEQCITIQDPPNEHTVVEALDRVSAWATDTLVVYYAGHGLLDDSPRASLYLGLTDTTHRLMVSNSVPFDVVRDVISHSNASTRVVILDCCYSGIAAEGAMGMSAVRQIESLIPVEGSYVLASSASTRTSMAPPGAHHTAFTGELIRVLRDGVPGGPRELDLETIYLRVRKALVARHFPEPQRLVRNTAHYLALVLNPAWVAQSDRTMSASASAEADQVAQGAHSEVTLDDISGPGGGPPRAPEGRPATPLGPEMETTSPTVGRRWVALEMRRLRVAAGLSQSDVAKALSWPVRKISLAENGLRSVERSDLYQLLELFRVPVDRWDQYINAADTAQRRAWWEMYGTHTVPEWLELFVGLEQGAERIRTFHPTLIHGLIQTTEYATSLIGDAFYHHSEEKVSRLVDLRRHRQAALSRAANPLEFWAILDEAALCHVVGDRVVMRSQLVHLVNLLVTSEHITIQVLPFDRAGLAGGTGPFTLLTFPFPNDPGVVYLEHLCGSLLLEQVPEVDTYSSLFQRLSKSALSRDDSLELLNHYIAEYGG